MPVVRVDRRLIHWSSAVLRLKCSVRAFMCCFAPAGTSHLTRCQAAIVWSVLHQRPRIVDLVQPRLKWPSKSKVVWMAQAVRTRVRRCLLLRSLKLNSNVCQRIHVFENHNPAPLPSARPLCNVSVLHCSFLAEIDTRGLVGHTAAYVVVLTHGIDSQPGGDDSGLLSHLASIAMPSHNDSSDLEDILRGMPSLVGIGHALDTSAPAFLGLDSPDQRQSPQLRVRVHFCRARHFIWSFVAARALRRLPA